MTMKIKRTCIRREPWDRILRRSQIFLPTEDRPGAVSLLRFDAITAPMVREYPDGASVAIVSEGAYWLQLGYESEPYFYTAMFDKHGEFRQVYVDITAGNVCTPPENTHFDDLFLDFVMTSSGKVYMLDRDELDAALAENVISKDTHDSVLRLADEKIAAMKNSGSGWKNGFIQLFNNLVPLL